MHCWAADQLWRRGLAGGDRTCACCTSAMQREHVAQAAPICLQLKCKHSVDDHPRQPVIFEDIVKFKVAGCRGATRDILAHKVTSKKTGSKLPRETCFAARLFHHGVSRCFVPSTTPSNPRRLSTFCGGSVSANARAPAAS